MNYKRIKNGLEHRANRFINERRGWKTDRKIVVIESDDWGSIRMPNRQVYDTLMSKGIRVDRSTYNKYDSLATKEDLSALFEVLTSYQDKNGKHPIVTANTCVANPLFDEIKKDKFENYYYEIFKETLNRERPGAYELWQEGIDNEIFYPQLHNREHLNVNKWLSYLRNKNSEALLAFELGLWGIGPLISKVGNPSFVRAFDETTYSLNEPLDKIIREGCNIFEDVFGFRSKSFIAPNCIWNDDVEYFLSKNGVKYLQGGYVQKLPNQIKHHYLGQRNQHKQIYLVRNVQFEPAGIETGDLVAQTVAQIDKAFKLGKPAIISTHRVAFIGAIFEENRTKNLRMLNELLGKIIKKWPDVEFMNSVQLGNLVSGTEK